MLDRYMDYNKYLYLLLHDKVKINVRSRQNYLSGTADNGRDIIVIQIRPKGLQLLWHRYICVYLNLIVPLCVFAI